MRLLHFTVLQWRLKWCVHHYTASSFRESLLSCYNAFILVTVGGVKKCHCGVGVQIGVFGHLTLLVIQRDPSRFFHGRTMQGTMGQRHAKDAPLIIPFFVGSFARATTLLTSPSFTLSSCFSPLSGLHVL
jgi:hypothetical protein